MKKSLIINILSLRQWMLLLVFGLFTSGANAGVIPLAASIDGVQEAPQVDGVGFPGQKQADLGGSGSASLLFDDTTNVLSWVISYSLNTGASTVAHFHGRRVAGAAGPGIASPTQLDILGIPGTSSGTVTGTFDFDVGTFLGPAPGTSGTLTRAERIDDLLAGLWYINIHTPVFPGGEIRGQILVVPEPSALALFGIGSLAMIGLALRRRRPA